VSKTLRITYMRERPKGLISQYQCTLTIIQNDTNASAMRIKRIYTTHLERVIISPF